MGNQGATICFLVLVCFLSVVGAVGHGRWFEKNNKQVRALQKSGPQPRAMRVTEIVKVGPSEKLVPSQTVLHYCDPIACCGLQANAFHRCEPKIEKVTLYFQAIDTVKKGERFVKYDFQNHTSCACHEK